jgi:hypothetical protein
MISVERGRWKFVISASTTRGVAGGRMKIRVSPAPARTAPAASAAASSVRTEVVPTAQTRLPASCVSATARAVSSGMT